MVTYFRAVSTFNSRDLGPDKALLRRDLVRSRGIPKAIWRPHDAKLRMRGEPRAFGPLLPSPGCYWGLEQTNTNARLATYGKVVRPAPVVQPTPYANVIRAPLVPFAKAKDRGFRIENYAKLDKYEKVNEDAKKERRKLVAFLRNPFRWWRVDDSRWNGLLLVPVRDHTHPLWSQRCQREHPIARLCRECWQDGLIVLAVDDPIRPWQPCWRLCEDHSTKERRARTHLRSNVPCVACGYRFDRRKGGALDEACYQEWRRARKQGLDWPEFTQMRESRARAGRVLMSLGCEWTSGDISPAWYLYLQRAIGRNHKKGVSLVLEGQSGTVVPLGRPVAASASSSNGSARVASFVFPHSIAKHLGGAYDTNGKRFTSFVSRPPHGGCR